MEERELTVDDLATRADEGDVSYFAYGGPVGEDMATEMQPSVSYFADGGSVDAQMLSIPDRPQYVGPSASAVQGPTAAQMLQSFADGGLVDSAAARMAMGAPAENLFGANLATPSPAPAPNYSFSLPTFNPTPVNFGGVTNPAAPALTFAGTQQVTPAPGAKTLYEQIAPSTFAAAPYDFSKAATSFTPTAQTFAKPTLLSAEEAIKQQPVLVRYQPDIKFGGLQTYQGPLQTSPYKDEEPSAPAQGPVGIGGLPTAATPAITRTPLGYEYSPYATLTPEQIAGSGNRAQVTDMFKGIVTQQQKDVDNVRTEYNQAVAVGNMPLANQLKGILTAQEQELATAKADQLNANKYFTGVGGAFETPEMLRQRVLGEQFKALKLGDELAFRGVDLGGIQVAAGAKADPFTAELTRQQNEATAAQNVYNRLVGAYGKDSQIAKDYLSQTLTPQQQEYQNMLALTRPAKGAVAPTNIFSAITAGEAYKGFTAPKLAEIRNVVQTENVYKPIITGFETNINNLVRAREQADSLGLSGYSNRLNQLIETENAKLEQARGERQSAIDRAQPDPMRDFILGKQLSAQKIEGFTGVDIGNVDFGKMQAAAFDPVITRQQQDVNAAQNTYNQLVSLYGANNDTTKAFLNDVLNPQKAELKQATDLKTAAGAAIGAYNTGRNYGYLNPPNIAVSRATKDETINKAYDDFIRNNYEKRIATLDAAKAKAEQAGLGQYGDYFNQLMDTQRSYIDRANQARDALFAKRDAATRAKGSPPEGEVADSRSRALLKKLSGGGEATTAPLQKFAKGGAVKKAAELLKGLGVSEGKVAGKELTTLQDAHTSLGDAVRERAAKMQQQMDAMEFKYGPGQYVFTESSAKKNLPPLEIKAKRLYGDQVMREPHPDNPLLGKVIKDPETGRAKRTPYEPGYLVRREGPDGQWSEFVIPQSAIKGAVDGFKHGGPVHRAQGSPVYGEMPDTGPITEDTRAAMRGSNKFSASEAARMLRNIAGEGVSNIESLLRGSVAAIPGSVGDIESIFRESDKTRKFATTEEVLRDYMPGRVTKPTKEAAGMEEVGSYLPLPVPAGTATKVAKGVKTGARKALEELGPTAATMLERTIPKMNIVPEGPGLPTNLSERIDQGKFFKGRLDDFVSQIRNPVTKEQFLGSLKGKFREYEISRAAQALEDLDNAAKLSPTDLVSRINTVAAPNRYKTTFIEPKTSGLHNNYDNVYGQTGQPIGVINLSYEPTRAAIEAEEASAAARSAAAALGRSKVNDPEKIQTLMSFLETSSDLAKDPERKTQLIAGLSKLDSQLSAAREEITPLAEGLTDIVYGNIPEFKSYTDKLREATKNISFPRGTPEYSEAFKNADEQVLSEIRIEALRRLYQEQPSLRTFLPLKEGETFDDLVQSLGGTKYAAQEVLPRMRKNIFERLDDTTKAILVDNKPLLDDILTETQRSSTYKGSHVAVNPEKNPMGFSRFSEHQVNVPGIGKLDGIYVSELQSDMFRDIKKLGKKGGSAAKDREELTSLFSGIKSKLEPLRTQIEDRFGSMDSFLFILRGDLTDKPNTANFSEFLTQLGPINKGKADQLATDLVKDVKRITKLQDRLGLPGKEVKGTYDIEEPIANIEVQPQVVQQLLAKNAIAGALKMGKDFVAFPGAESKQAKLYEKLPRNLDAVLKDLGEGFTKQAITIKDATGTERQHWAVIWDKNAAQRVLNNGVPFKKGGLVEKSKVDNRRYI